MKATAISRKNKTRPPPNIKISLAKVFPPPFTSLINRWPATILAAKRTDNVIGRIKFLTSSINTIKGIRALGVPDGTKCDKKLARAFKK